MPSHYLNQCWLITARPCVCSQACNWTLVWTYCKVAPSSVGIQCENVFIMHVGLDRMTTFMNSLSCVEIVVLWFKVYRNLLHWVQLTIASTSFDNGLTPKRQQVSIWSKDGLVYWRINAPFCLDELIFDEKLCAFSLLLYLVLYQHDDVMKWKHFPRYWPFVRGIHRSPVNSLHKGQWRGALMFSLICVWINGSVNNREAGDLRRHRAHYDIILMNILMMGGEEISSTV